MKKIAIIGAGASGIVAALFASEGRNSITLFEKQNKIGRKILASGNGRCNLSNRNIDISNYNGRNPGFAIQVISKFGLDDTLQFFESIGIPVVEEKNGKLFPESLNASSMVKIFEYELERKGVDLQLNRKIEKIILKKQGFKLVTAGREEHICDSVILSAGSCAYPQLGASGEGYELAESLGHTVFEPFPSILPLNVPLKAIHTLQGIKRECKISVVIDGKTIDESAGDLLFTKYGISGNAILDISRSVNESVINGGKPKILIDFFPDLSLSKLTQKIEKLGLDREKGIAFSLLGVMQFRLAEVLLRLSGIDPYMPLKKMTGEQKRREIEILKSFELIPGKARSFNESIAAAGGIDVNEIDPLTMESKKHKRLYLTGELLDIDGDTGGYNLQFAWSTGALAGKAQHREV